MELPGGMQGGQVPVIEVEAGVGNRVARQSTGAEVRFLKWSETGDAQMVRREAWPSIPHLRGSLCVQGDVVLGPRASREFFRRHRCLAVTEKLDGYNVAILFERPWALRLFHRGLDLHELYAAWVPPALVWVEAELGRLYRMLREDWVLCGEWVDPRSSLEYPGSSGFFAFDLYQRPSRRWSPRR